MPDDAELIRDACREIAAELRAAADVEADLTPEERRWLVEIALAVERAQSGKEKGPG